MTEPPQDGREKTIHAPWTPEQVAALNAFQQRGGMHPFTCGFRGSVHALREGVLIAGPDGWHCPIPGCLYTQNWAHAFMAEPSAQEPPAPATAVCRHCGDPIAYGPFYPDAYPGPNPPVWRHDRGDGIGAQICATPHLRAEPAASAPNNPPTSTDAANNPLKEQIYEAMKARYLDHAIDTGQLSPRQQLESLAESALGVVERETAQLRRERDMALAAASEARGAVKRAHRALASFDGRGVLGIGCTNLDIPTAGEVLDAVRAALEPKEAA